MPPASPELSKEAGQRFARGLRVGQRVEIGLGDQDALTWLVTRLEDHDALGSQLTVAWPTDCNRELAAVVLGQRVDLAASTPDDALYSAHAHIEGTHTQPVPLLELRVVGPWRRLQRRSEVRASVAIFPRQATKLTADGPKPIRLGITNLSAAGLQVRSRDELRIAEHIELTFGLADLPGELQLMAEVRRVERQERDGVQVWEAGCQFTRISDRDQQRIVQFIFAQQRALARQRKA